MGACVWRRETMSHLGPLLGHGLYIEPIGTILAAYSTSVRQGIEQADALGDRDTADIFTEISRGVDTYLWFVEAHLAGSEER